MALTNHKFLLAARPVGMPKRSDWTYSEEPVAEPKEGELLVKVLYISLDPAMRIWINDAAFLHAAGRHRRGDAGTGRGHRDRVAQPALRGG